MSSARTFTSTRSGCSSRAHLIATSGDTMDQPDPFGFVGLTYDDVMLLPGTPT